MQPYDAPGEAVGLLGGGLSALIFLAIVLVVIASMWIIFTKAGRPGWAAIIPIYNVFVALQIAGMSGWWLIAFLIPLINIIAAILLAVNLAAAFGRGVLFAIGLLLLPIIFYPILAFGDSRYVGR